MRKKAIVKLYTMYSVKGKYDDISNNPEHQLKAYSAGIGYCIKYHDNLDDFINEIVLNKFRCSFGMKVVNDDGRDIWIHKTLQYNMPTNLNNYNFDNYIRALGNLIIFYTDFDGYYYELEDNMAYIRTELTGHMYYRSPYESCDSCSTCDGARCCSCHIKYIVENLTSNTVYYTGFDKEKAQEAKLANSTDCSNIINDILQNYNISESDVNGMITDSINDFKALMRIVNEYKIPYLNIY